MKNINTVNFAEHINITLESINKLNESSNLGDIYILNNTSITEYNLTNNIC